MGTLSLTKEARIYNGENTASSISGSLVAQTVKRLPIMQETQVFKPWVKNFSWRKKSQPTPVIFPGKSHGQRSLVDYSPWGPKESDTTERLQFK